MHLLAYIYHAFLEKNPVRRASGDAGDMYDSSSFDALEEAIHEVCQKDKDKDDTIINADDL